MLLIYSPEISQRLEYTLDLIFRQQMNISYRITSFIEEIRLEEGPKLAYCFTPVDDCFTVPASGLLFERNVTSQENKIGRIARWGDLPVFFTREGNFNLTFDLFSAVFYMVSRYEEYLPFESDEHQRFQSGESYAFHNGFLDRPLVNEWLLKFADLISQEIPNCPASSFPPYRFIPTIDIDQAWAFRNKGCWRTLGGMLRDINRPDLRNYRYQAIRGNQPDPFDTYDLIELYHGEAAIRPIWFFLLGDHGKHDKNSPHRNPELARLIGQLASRDETGIHPSYASNASSHQISTEIERLKKLSGKPVTKSRQHFLKMEMPQTYRLLNNLGIKEDYTMGYAERPGFRAGIASPFTFFDLEDNKVTDLTVFPFQLMDITLQRYLKLQPEEAVEAAEKLIDRVKAVNGTFITLWHNESLSEWKEWTAWSEVYRQILIRASSQ